jgi:hypothetical protein
MARAEPIAGAPPAKAEPMARVALEPMGRAALAKATAESAMVMVAGTAAVSSELERGVSY